MTFTVLINGFILGLIMLDPPLEVLYSLIPVSVLVVRAGDFHFLKELQHVEKYQFIKLKNTITSLIVYCNIIDYLNIGFNYGPVKAD